MPAVQRVFKADAVLRKGRQNCSMHWERAIHTLLKERYIYPNLPAVHALHMKEGCPHQTTVGNRHKGRGGMPSVVSALGKGLTGVGKVIITT